MSKNKSASSDIAAWVANFSPETLALNAAALAELDRPGVDPLTLERNAGVLGVEVGAPSLVSQSIVLALPPSANRYWRYGPNGVHVSEEAENYKAGVKWKVLHQRMQPMAGNVAVYVNVYRARKAGDLDNFAKVILDSLNGAAYTDDSQVTELHMWRHDDKDNPRVEVEIRKQEAR